MKNKEILSRLETILEIPLRDLETTEERVHTALDRAAAMSTDGLLSESEQSGVFRDIRELILNEEIEAKKALSVSGKLWELLVRTQKTIELAKR